MPTGKVKWFNDAKGYGFIERGGGEPDVFVHYSSILMRGHKTLDEGAEVTFDVVKDAKGLRADNVVVVRSVGDDESARTRPQSADVATGLTGPIVTWQRDKAYGFIAPADGSDQVFVHISAIADSSLVELADDPDLANYIVTFDAFPDPGRQRRRAENVLLTEQPQPQRTCGGWSDHRDPYPEKPNPWAHR